METAAKKKGYPKAFWTCACTEIFERLSYYLGRSLILIFVSATVATGGLGLDDTVAANMQSNLTAFSYLLPLFGGIVVDRFIGAKYTTPVGMAIAGVGYYMGGIATSATGVYAMIFLVSLGLALFKNGPIIGRVITDKSQMDPAFAMRYTLVNVGAFIGTFLVGILYKDVFAKDGVLGFAPCFKLAGLVMFLGALWYVFVCWRFLGDVGRLPFKKTKTAEELEAEKQARQEGAKDLEKERRQDRRRLLHQMRKNVSERSLSRQASRSYSGYSGILDICRYISIGQRIWIGSLQDMKYRLHGLTRRIPSSV